MEPASIRYKNPGAMWGSALAIKWGANKRPVTLNDGKGQGNNIAVFPTYVQGICAQLDLWRTSKNYRNKPFKDAIRIWSGGNSVESYIAFVRARVPGMTRNTIMDDAFWRSPKGIAFLKAQAWHEAGKPYPAPAADWIEAQRRVFAGAPSAPKRPSPARRKPPVAETTDADVAPEAPVIPIPKAPPLVQPPPANPAVQGDPELWNVQRRLKAMMYNPGGLDGIWGGLSAGAISGFLNDRQSNIDPPTSIDDFHDVQEQLKAAIGKAEGERFTRPVTLERGMATPAELAPKLPEVDASIKAERVGFWGSIAAAFSATVIGISKFFGDAIEWLNPLREFISDLPWPVWVFGALAIAYGLYYQSRKSGDAKNAATQAYQEGSRA